LTAAAPPDGYTLMLCNIASHAVTSARVKKLPYDHIRDFAFVSMVGTTPNVIATHPSMAMKSLKDVIAYAARNPGKLNYGSSGVGASPNLSMELLKLQAGVNIVHVPYRGAALAMGDVMSGHLELLAANLPGPLPQIKAGKVRALAVTSGERNSRVPDVPSVAEQGLPGFDVSSWYGICTQAAVPKPVFDKLRADLLKALDLPETRKRLYDQAIDIKTSSPGEFVEHVKTETVRWAKVVRDAHIPAE
jgi:tripartite-type tricarboxylate transporter receptor subunit TctC